VTGATGRAPFQGTTWNAACALSSGSTLFGDRAIPNFYDRETANNPYSDVFPVALPVLCGSVHPIVVTSPAQPAGALGSLAQTVSRDPAARNTYQNGQVIWGLTGDMSSLATSTRTDVASGAVTTGSHAFSGLPVVGFAATTLTNGFLQCGSSVCRGNYGNAVPFAYSRNIRP